MANGTIHLAASTLHASDRYGWAKAPARASTVNPNMGHVTMPTGLSDWRSTSVRRTTTTTSSKKAIRSRSWNWRSGGRKSIAVKVAISNRTGDAISACRGRKAANALSCAAHRPMAGMGNRIKLSDEDIFRSAYFRTPKTRGGDSLPTTTHDANRQQKHAYNAGHADKFPYKFSDVISVVVMFE